MWIPPPPPLGSGKFGTPCERMQSAKRIPCPGPLEPAVLFGLPEEPQAVIANAQAMTVSVISRLWQRLLGGVLVDAWRMWFSIRVTARPSCRGRSVTGT